MGNTGKIISINASTKDITISIPPEDYYKNYIGGSGLAAKIFFEHGDMNAHPLSPEAMLLFMNGPFAGLKLSGASRSCVAGRSPLTGCWGDSSCGGYFAPELRYAGYDGIMITGRFEKPSILVIEDDNITISDGEDLWGQGVEKTISTLKERYGKKYRVVAIGPAGENLVKYACIINEGHHAFGRAGFGAVMGAKYLKAIVVKASKKNMDLAAPQAFEDLRKELSSKIKDGLLADLLNVHGTAANLEGGMYAGDVPIKNFSSNFSQEMGEKLGGDQLTELYLTKKRACLYCAIACKRVVEVKEGPFAIPEGPGPEYETIVSFGSLLNSSDLAAACKAGRICNDLGLDTISAGGTIAWAMEAYEKKHLTDAETDGIELKWGDLQTVIDILLPKIAFKKGSFGELLAEGSKYAALKIGKNSIDYTAQSKGLEAPMHDPRGGGHGLAITYAMSARGACHVADPMLYMEMGACFWPEINFEYELEPMTDENKPEAAAISVAIGAIENSACYCSFADGDFTIDDWLSLFKTVAGFDWTPEEMLKTGRRIFFLKRIINYRYGLSSKDDILTPKMLSPSVDGEPKGIEINFSEMKETFYTLMGMDSEKGVPTPETLSNHDINNVGIYPK